MQSPQVSIPTAPLADFCRRWKITELALFGSVLREDFRGDSDIDALVTFDPSSHWSLWDVMKARDELAAMLRRRVDLIDRPALEQHHNPWLRHSILSDARVIYKAA